MAKRKPNIIISTSDYNRLTLLAESVSSKMPKVAETLLAELDRARVVEGGATVRQSIRMGSTVTYETEEGHNRSVTLVYPVEADINQGRISVLTPIGIALLGLRARQSINWTANDGVTHQLTVLSVEPPKE
ncbi:nucleoside diphosphate kinase regulator [Aureimonas fodinaquatilis]|uniref:Nucleoside diphosphate kinase regulator n=1 Tax=Aureimonas fodinaquatilis TaxID=2565783 RepID=A0A5B0DY20_9HYPH|nr:nucleoside diphosphate kinase regulator [Aureimonas fodinaquatilis]KAA0970460.1 nucleoside diphosphate kinase regulator [Aureimonas fodinaquatilis]